MNDMNTNRENDAEHAYGAWAITAIGLAAGALAIIQIISQL